MNKDVVFIFICVHAHIHTIRYYSGMRKKEVLGCDNMEGMTLRALC